MLSKTILGRKLISRNFSFMKKVDGYEDDYFHVLIKKGGFMLAYIFPEWGTQTSEGHFGSTIVHTSTRAYFVFDSEKNVVAAITNNNDAKKYLKEYFSDLTQWHNYLESIDYNYKDVDWRIMDLVSEVLAAKYYKGDPVKDNKYYTHKLGTQIKVKKAIKEVEAFATKDESNTTTE
jgi:hypothetical protein